MTQWRHSVPKPAVSLGTKRRISEPIIHENIFSEFGVLLSLCYAGQTSLAIFYKGEKPKLGCTYVLKMCNIWLYLYQTLREIEESPFLSHNIDSF